MSESSMFFSGPLQNVLYEEKPLPLHSSESGHSELFLINRDGKFRVLKCLKEEYRGNPVYESLLRKEFEIGYQLDHPNICNTISFCQTENLGNCIEMEWVDGCTLRELLSRKKPDEHTSKKLILEICDALDYIAGKQIIHRDLKPENILITYNGANVKLIDFGFSDSDSHAVHKESAGTRSYASPEQLSGGEIDARSDIYSLGLIIREMGRPYGSIANKCTRRNPSMRYSSAGDLKRAIENNGTKRIFFWAIATVLLCALAAWLIFRHPQPAADINILFEEISDSIEAVSEK